MLAQKRTRLSIWKHRLLGRLRAWACRLRGQHQVSATDWGFSGGGMVDCYCPNCLKIVARKPLEDFEGMGRVIDTLSDL